MSRPVLVVDNGSAGQRQRGLVAVCVASFEGVGRTTSQLGSEAAGAATAEYAKRLSSLAGTGDQLIQIHEAKHCLLLRRLCDESEAAAAGARLESVFSEPFRFRDLSIPLQVRAGIAWGVDQDADAESLFRAAETAREAARSSERMVQLADATLLADMRRRWELNDQVDEALARHQLKLYYQPKMAAGEHRLVGAEGLVRWEHPDGLLTPAQFLPHLEADKMMAMTQHLVRQCVRDLAGNPWLPPLSLNLDADIADEASLLELIMDELTVWHVDPARLMIEIAEAGLVRRLDRLLEGLAGLRGRGVRISMDDFGTGGAALARFPRLLVDEVKIDRCFVLGIEHHAAHRYLAGMMTELAHYFGMSVVAEGVETEAAADSLRETGCDTLQGFLFSPPLPLDEFSRWVARQPEPGDCA